MLTIGKVYLLRGGHILRYLGFYANPDGSPGEGPVLAFQCVREPIPKITTGYSALEQDVLREITAKDTLILTDRLDSARQGHLPEEVADLTFLLAELNPNPGEPHV